MHHNLLDHNIITLPGAVVHEVPTPLTVGLVAFVDEHSTDSQLKCCFYNEQLECIIAFGVDNPFTQLDNVRRITPMNLRGRQVAFRSWSLDNPSSCWKRGEAFPELFWIYDEAHRTSTHANFFPSLNTLAHNQDGHFEQHKNLLSRRRGGLT